MATERSCDRFFEWRLGVNTARVESVPDSTRFGHEYHSYEPSYYRGIRKVLKVLTACEGGTFIDYGSGAGRVLVMVAVTCRFRRVVGIELSPQLNDFARKNIDMLRARAACSPVDLVAMDAAAYAVPDDASVLFFADSFGGEILASVCRNIRESLRRAPRRLVFIGYNHESLGRLTSQMDHCEWLRVSRQVRLLGRVVAIVYTNTADVGPADHDEPS
jgi:precorrin-6B methylase 2